MEKKFLRRIRGITKIHKLRKYLVIYRNYLYVTKEDIKHWKVKKKGKLKRKRIKILSSMREAGYTVIIKESIVEDDCMYGKYYKR